MLLLHGCSSKWPSACSFSPLSLLDGADSVVRGEAAACFFCSKVTAGVTFPSQGPSAKSWYLPARWFTHLAWLSLSGTRPSGWGREEGVKKKAAMKNQGSEGGLCPLVSWQACHLLCHFSFDILGIVLVFAPSPTVRCKDQYQFHCCAYSMDKPLQGILPSFAERQRAERNFSFCQKSFSISPFYISVTHVHMKTFFHMSSFDICSLAGDVTVGTALKTRKQMEQARTDRNNGSKS